MSLRNSTEVTIAYDDGPGGVSRALTGVTLEMGGLKIEQGSQDGTAYGDLLKKQYPTGVGEIMECTIRGFMNTAASSSHAVFKTPDSNPNGATRTLTVGLGGAVTWTTEGYLKSYEVITKPGALTEFVATLVQNSGGWN